MLQTVIQAFRLMHHDPDLAGLTVRTLQLAFASALIAAMLGFPAACAIGLGRSRVSRWSLIVANAGLGLPPVAVGVYGFLLLPGLPDAPWGGPWIGEMNGMVLAQTLLSLPVIIALGAIAVRRLPSGLADQAAAFGASGWRLGVFVLREAKIGAITAVIVAIGSAMCEVGAVTLIGGNSPGTRATLASQILNDSRGSVAAVEHLIVLLALMLVLGVAFTVMQQWNGRSVRGAVRRQPATAEELYA